MLYVWHLGCILILEVNNDYNLPPIVIKYFLNTTKITKLGWCGTVGGSQTDEFAPPNECVRCCKCFQLNVLSEQWSKFYEQRVRQEREDGVVVWLFVCLFKPDK